MSVAGAEESGHVGKGSHLSEPAEWGLGRGLVVQPLPSVHGALGSIPRPQTKERKNKGN